MEGNSHEEARVDLPEKVSFYEMVAEAKGNLQRQRAALIPGTCDCPSLLCACRGGDRCACICSLGGMPCLYCKPEGDDKP